MTDEKPCDVRSAEELMADTADRGRQLRLAETTLRTFARSATGPGDRPALFGVLLDEYDRLRQVERRYDRLRDTFVDMSGREPDELDEGE